MGRSFIPRPICYLFHVADLRPVVPLSPSPTAPNARDVSSGRSAEGGRWVKNGATGSLGGGG